MCFDFEPHPKCNGRVVACEKIHAFVSCGGAHACDSLPTGIGTRKELELVHHKIYRIRENGIVIRPELGNVFLLLGCSVALTENLICRCNAGYEDCEKLCMMNAKSNNVTRLKSLTSLKNVYPF
jgi:hypothetical protein